MSLAEREDMKEFVEELIKQLEERIQENNGWEDDEFFGGQSNAFEWTISIINKLSEEYLKSGKCMNDCEHYDNCSDYIYSKGYNKAIDDVFNFLKNHRDKKYMKVNLDDLDIRKYKEQLQS